MTNFNEEKGRGNRYSLELRYAYAMGIEKLVIPKSIRKKLTKSTIHRWRQENAEALFEKMQAMGQSSQTMLALSKNSDRRQAEIHAYMAMRMVIILRTTKSKEAYKRLLKKNKQQIVNTLEPYQDDIDLRSVLKIIGLKKGTYDSWVEDTKFKCYASWQSLCAKKHTNQLTDEEIKIIHDACIDPAWEHWPLHAIHSRLRQDGRLSCHYTTFTRRHNEMFPKRRFEVAKQNKKGVSASVPNEFWHIDITKYKTSDGQKASVYMIMDNYSRRILAYKVSRSTSDKYIVRELILESVRPLIGKNKDLEHQLDLISDAGVENKNKVVSDLFLELNQKIGLNMNHKIAQFDIPESNSMIERLFRIIKGQYLRRLDPPSFKHLKSTIDDLVYEYNYVRPHYAHAPYTPDQAYHGLDNLDLKGMMEEAIIKRRKANKNCDCTVCDCRQ